MAKRSSDPWVAYPEVKVQVRDLVRVVGIVAAFAPRGSVRWENSFYRATGGKWAQATCARCPQQRYKTEELEPRKVQGRGRVRIVGESCDYRARRVSMRGKLVISRNRGYKTRGRHMAKRSSDTRVACPEVIVQVRDLVRDVGSVGPFAPRRVGSRKKLVY